MNDLKNEISDRFLKENIKTIEPISHAIDTNKLYQEAEARRRAEFIDTKLEIPNPLMK